jgi:glycosyltransferase involved in cell wall biosynthesis
VEAWDFSDYDVVISSTSSGCAKGIITKPDTLHISYCHNPSRVLWGGSQAYGKLHRYAPPLSWLIPRQLKKLRLWDRVAADRVDFFLANSECVARRIEKYYQAEAEVIYPPVDTKAFAPASDVKAGNYFLAVGRLIPYKRFDLVVQAANVLGLPLRVVGTGPEEQYLRSIAGPTVKFFGSVSEEQLRRMYAECKALVFPQEEDFGLTAVEVQAAGRPVVAYRAGGALETVVSGRTGIFFTQQTVAALGDAMERAAKTRWVTKSIQKNAERFDLQHFKKQIDTLVTESFAAW